MKRMMFLAMCCVLFYGLPTSFGETQEVVLTNPGFEQSDGVSEWNGKDDKDGWYFESGDVNPWEFSADAHTGNRAARLNFTGTNWAWVGMGMDDVLNASFTRNVDLTLSFYAKWESGDNQIIVGCNYRDKDGNWGGDPSENFALATVPTDGEWHLITIPISFSASTSIGVAYNYLQFKFGTHQAYSAAESILIDDISMTVESRGIIWNGDFEKGNGDDGWGFENGDISLFEFPTGEAYSGDRCMRFSFSGTNWAWLDMGYNDTLNSPIAWNSNVTLSFYAKWESGDNRIIVGVNELYSDYSWGTYQENFASATVPMDGEWHLITIPFTYQATITMYAYYKYYCFKIGAKGDYGIGAESILIDDISLVSEPISHSTILWNGDFEKGDGSEGWDFQYGGGSNSSAFEFPTEDVYSGNRCYKMTFNGSGWQWLGMGSYSIADSPIKNGDNLLFSFRGKWISGDNKIFVGGNFVKRGDLSWGTNKDDLAMATIPMDGEWHLITVPFTLKAPDGFTNENYVCGFKFGGQVGLIAEECILLDEMSLTIVAPGDVNNDGVIDSLDIDSLYAAIGAGSTESKYDLDSNGTVEKADVDYLVQTILGTAYGDANLDKAVDVGDLGILAANYGLTSGATWATGDFNGDGAVDVGDLGILAANYGAGSSSASSFEADYAKVFGTDSTSTETTDDSSTVCSSLGLSLIAGLAMLGLMLVKLEE